MARPKLSIVKWDTARRSYILFMGQFKRAWTAKYITDKIKSIIKNSEACEKCKCGCPLDAMYQDTFFCTSP